MPTSQAVRDSLLNYIYLGGRPIALAVAQLDASAAVTSHRYQVIATDHLGTPWAVVDPDYQSTGDPVAVWKAALGPVRSRLGTRGLSAPLWRATSPSPATIFGLKRLKRTNSI